jgi:FAD/FMN-containing dehydrogenase
MTAAGEALECSRDMHPEVFRAGRVSLGALGVITAVRLQLIPAYRLHERLWKEPIDACLARLDEQIASNRHFEFFWYPATDLAHAKALNPTELEPSAVAGREGERIDASWRVFPTVRENRFNEMEYSLPAEAGPDCFREIRELTRHRHAAVTWPVEYRTLAADDIDLSTALARDTVTISIHQDARLECRPFFTDAEKIFRAHQGRPHWGKMHSLGATELRPLYPPWDHFLEIRRGLDPSDAFLNPHLRQLFG